MCEVVLSVSPVDDLAWGLPLDAPGPPNGVGPAEWPRCARIVVFGRRDGRLNKVVSGGSAHVERSGCGAVSAAQRECTPPVPELSALRRGIVGGGSLLELAWGVMTGDGAAVFREAVAESCCALSEKER